MDEFTYIQLPYPDRNGNLQSYAFALPNSDTYSNSGTSYTVCDGHRVTHIYPNGNAVADALAKQRNP